MIPTTDIVANGTPAGWRTAPFWSLFRRKKKIGFSKEELLSVYRDYGVIPKSSRDDNHNKESEDLSGYQLVTEGALVTNKMKAWQGSIAISRYRGIVSPAYYVYTPQSNECDQFLHYLLRSEPYIGLYGRISKGVRVNQWDLEHEALRNIPVIVPDLATQRRIADFLDRETARIDLLIEKKQRLVALLGEKWESLVEYAISTGGKRTKLGHHIDILSGYAFPSSDFSTDPDDIPLLRGANISPGSIRWGDTVYWPRERLGEVSRFLLNPGDVVLGMDRPWISSGIRVAEITEKDAPSFLLQRVCRIEPCKTLDKQFMKLLLTSRQFLAYFEPIMTGVSVPHISPDQVTSFRFEYVEKDEQVRRAAAAIRERDRIIRVQKSTEKSIDRLKEYRSALITAAVTGQIDVETYAKSGAPDRHLDAIQEEMGARDCAEVSDLEKMEADIGRDRK